jgi:hypothetical protein
VILEIFFIFLTIKELKRSGQAPPCVWQENRGMVMAIKLVAAIAF